MSTAEADALARGTHLATVTVRYDLLDELPRCPTGNARMENAK